jgi:glycosyltransferase involved in cell wall biosynthesis
MGPLTLSANHPRVSVVIPAYNAAPFIADTLASVFAQTYTSYEVIVVNDGSPDTPAFEQAIAPYRNRIVYLKQCNTGPSGARNRGIQEGRGEYVAFLDSDDQWLPRFLAEQMRILDADPAIDLLYSDGLIFGMSPLAGRTLMSVSPSRGEVTFESLVREACTVLTTCTIARRSTVIAAGLFDERFLRSEDFHLWLRMAYNGARIVHSPQVLVRHRRREGSLAHDTRAMIRAFVDVLQDLDMRLPLSAPLRAAIRRQTATREAELAVVEGKEHFFAGQYVDALQALQRACAMDPRWLTRVRLRIVGAAVRVAPRLLRRTYDIIRPAALPPPAKGVS